MDDRRRAVAERARPSARPPTPAARSSSSSASWASRRPVGRAAVEDRRLAGLEREREVPAQVRRAGPAIGLKTRS